MKRCVAAPAIHAKAASAKLARAWHARVLLKSSVRGWLVAPHEHWIDARLGDGRARATNGSGMDTLSSTAGEDDSVRGEDESGVISRSLWATNLSSICSVEEARADLR